MSGSVVETTKGTAGILPAGATATVAASGFGGTTGTGIQVTFGGALAAAQLGAATVGSLGFTNLTGSATGFFNKTEKGGPATGNQGYTQQRDGQQPADRDRARPVRSPSRTGRRSR